MISLLPDDYMTRRSQHKAQAVAVVLFAIVMIGVIVAAIFLKKTSRRTVEVGDRILESYREAAKLLAEFQELEAERDAVLKRAQARASMLDKVPRSYLLALVTNATPECASLTRFELRTEPAGKKEHTRKVRARSSQSARAARNPSDPGNEPPITMVRVDITGLGATDVDVATFMTNLARNPMTDSVDLVYSQEKRIEKIPVREFKVRLQLNADRYAQGGSSQTR